jgi:hypothetical protein
VYLNLDKAKGSTGIVSHLPIPTFQASNRKVLSPSSYLAQEKYTVDTFPSSKTFISSVETASIFELTAQLSNSDILLFVDFGISH